jgi:hypothetical protein
VASEGYGSRQEGRRDMNFIILYKAPLMDDWSVYMNYKADTLADAINYAAMLQRTDTKHKRQFKSLWMVLLVRPLIVLKGLMHHNLVDYYLNILGI